MDSCIKCNGVQVVKTCDIAKCNTYMCNVCGIEFHNEAGAFRFGHNNYDCDNDSDVDEKLNNAAVKKIISKKSVRDPNYNSDDDLPDLEEDESNEPANEPEKPMKKQPANVAAKKRPAPVDFIDDLTPEEISFIQGDALPMSRSVNQILIGGGNNDMINLLKNLTAIYRA